MAIKKTAFASGILPVPMPDEAGELTIVRATYAVPADIALNDIIDMVQLPPGCTPAFFRLDSDDLDSDISPAMTLDVGIMTGKPGDDVELGG